MATRVQISSPGVLSLNSNNNKVIFLIRLKPYHCFEVLKVERMLSLMMYFLLPWRNFEIMIHATSLVKKISLNQASLQLFRTFGNDKALV